MSDWHTNPEPVEVERATEQSVIIGGRRRARRSQWANYFQTEDEARQFFIAQQEKKVERAREELRRAESHLAKLRKAAG
jgi:hypothetical protein